MLEYENQKAIMTMGTPKSNFTTITSIDNNSSNKY